MRRNSFLGGWGNNHGSRNRQNSSSMSVSNQSRAPSNRPQSYSRANNPHHIRVKYIQKLFHELNTAIAPSEQRLFAINETLREVDHEDEFRHDEEIKCSADIILFQKLALSLAIDCSNEEVPLICTALEMIYRASRLAISASFEQIGMSVLPLIMEIIRRPQQYTPLDAVADNEASDLGGVDGSGYGWNGDDTNDEFYDHNSSYVDQPQPNMDIPVQKPEVQVHQSPQTSRSVHLALENSPHEYSTETIPSIQHNQNEQNINTVNERSSQSKNIDYNDIDSDYNSQNYHSNYNGYSLEADPKLPTPVKEDSDEDKNNLSMDQQRHHHLQHSPKASTNTFDSSQDILDPMDPYLDPIDPNKSISPDTNDKEQINQLQHILEEEDTEEEKMIDVDLISRFNEGIEEDKRNIPNPSIELSPSTEEMRHQHQHPHQHQHQHQHQHPQQPLPPANNAIHNSNTPVARNGKTTNLEDDLAQSLHLGGMHDVNNNQFHDQHLHQNEQVHENMYPNEPIDSYQSPNQYQDQYNSYSHPDEKEDDDINVLSGMNPLPIDITDTSIGPPESAMNKILKVLRYYSRVLNAMVPLAHFPGLLDAILYQIQRCSMTDSFKNNERTEARIDAIAIIVNLACAEDNKISLVEEPNLIRTVTRLARYDTVEKVREHATIVLLNLSYADENKVRLANEDGLLSTLAELLCDSSTYTRRYAAASLFTLAGDVKNSELIATHEQGLVLEALRILLLKEPSEEARISAAEAIFIMTRSNSELAVMAIANHPRLLDALAEAIVNEMNDDVRMFAARALEWLSSDIHHPMICHTELLGALVKASQWTKTSSIAEAMKTQASLQNNRQVMARHPGLLGALAGLSLLQKSADAQTKSYAISAIERLSTEPANMEIMAKNSLIMTALTRANFSGNYDDQLQGDDYMNSNSYLLKTALKNLAGYM